MSYYDEVKKMVINAINSIENEHEGNYKGYTGNNAISLYMNDEHSINVTSDNTAERAFNDAIAGIARRTKRRQAR